MSGNIGELFIQGGWVMWPLLVFSVLTWAVIIERSIVFLSLRPKINRLSQAVLNSLRAGDVAAAKQICHAEKQHLSELFLGAIDTKRTKALAESATDRNKARMIAYLKKNLWILGTIGSASPFNGHLGTVIGILRAFHSMAQKGTGGFAVVASGISESLIATAAGLVVAIVSLITYNIFVSIANQMVGSLKLTLDEVVEKSFEKTPAAVGA